MKRAYPKRPATALTDDDIRLLAACRKEREQLRIQSRRLRELSIKLGKEADELSDDNLAKKFEVARSTIQRWTA